MKLSLEASVCQKVLTPFDIRTDVDFVRKFGNVDFESVLDVVESLGVGLIRNHSDGQAFCAEATRSRHAMQIRVGIFGHVVVEDDVHSLDVHTTTEQVGCYQDAFLEILELLVAG